MSDLEKRKAQADAEYQDLLHWAVEEGKKVTEDLKREGAIMGLDGHQERFAYIKETVKARIKEIVWKYDLPNKTEWA